MKVEASCVTTSSHSAGFDMDCKKNNSTLLRRKNNFQENKLPQKCHFVANLPPLYDALTVLCFEKKKNLDEDAAAHSCQHPTASWLVPISWSIVDVRV